MRVKVEFLAALLVSALGWVLMYLFFKGIFVGLFILAHFMQILWA